MTNRKSVKRKRVMMISTLYSSKNNTRIMKGKVISVEKGRKDEMNGNEALRKRMENWRKTEKILGDIEEFSQESYSRQNAVAYIIYMMAGSYFASGTSNGRFRNLYLHYAEMPKEKQYENERRVIASVEKLGEDFLRKISGLRCETVCRRSGEELLMEFQTGGFEGLSFQIGKNGNFRLSPT